MAGLRVLVAAACWAPLLALGGAPSNAEIEQLCAQAEDAAHCGRLIEEAQLKRLPELARRQGNVLVVSLYPSGSTTFTDSDDPVNGRSYSLWDYLDGINAVLVYTTIGDNASFMLLQRTNNLRFELPTEPKLSPDRQRLVTADICATRCMHEIAVWRISRDGLRKELTWSPSKTWIDASANWKDAETLAIDYTLADSMAGATLERKLNDPTWKRVAAP